MFAGGRRRSSNNVRAMQLFHELKQQFPTVPDHLVTACISGGDAPPTDKILREVLETAANLQHELMGRSSVPTEAPAAAAAVANNNQTTTKPTAKLNLHQTNNLWPDKTNAERLEMNTPNSDATRNLLKAKRPDTLELQQSDKCRNVHKLLNAEKPPRSPKNKRDKSDSEHKTDKPQTAETPTQTTDTLLNLSLNVNVDVSRPKRTAALQITPQQPWCQDLPSPRSYTSVNLTLRPPSSEPQPPIDITSRNSSLTYTTSTFDSQKGLQSKLQITVSPNGGSVSSVRTRPRSYHLGDADITQPAIRMGSLQDLSTCIIAPALIKQQSRIDKLRIELRSEKMRLVATQTEVARLESARNDTASERTDAELERQLLKEIRHLRGQCERLTIEVDRQTETGVPLGETSEEFYRNIYTGQRGPVDFGRPARPRDNYGPKWSCPLCTFQNHPLLDKCEQCDMARILHVSAAPGDNIHIHVTPRINRRIIHSWVI